MHLNQYQQKARDTAIYGDEIRVSYPALGLAGEAGEVANIIKKVMRDKGGAGDVEDLAKLKKELGDVLWYVAVLASDLSLSLDDIAKENLKKLQGRKQRGTLGGSGDDR